MSGAQKHTPGPWQASPATGSVTTFYVRTKSKTIASVYGTEANARLIAAAPDMLEALKMAKIWLDVDGRYDMQAINAAIAKATGEQP